MFSHIKVGDKVKRNLGGVIMDLYCTERDAKFIYCGAPGIGWKFDRHTGSEVDEELEWDNVRTGSRLMKENKIGEILSRLGNYKGPQ
jgi:hypothetical protein